jgi:hypothetical protein
MKLILIVLPFLLMQCAEIPEHTNPYDPNTPNLAPTSIELDPATAITEVKKTSVEIYWTPVDDDDFLYYDVLATSTPQVENSWQSVSRLKAAYLSRYETRSLRPDSTYYTRIRVTDMGGLTSLSNMMMFKTAPNIVPIQGIKSVDNTVAQDVRILGDTAIMAASLYQDGDDFRINADIVLKNSVGSSYALRSVLFENLRWSNTAPAGFPQIYHYLPQWVKDSIDSDDTFDREYTSMAIDNAGNIYAAYVYSVLFQGPGDGGAVHFRGILKLKLDITGNIPMLYPDSGWNASTPVLDLSPSNQSSKQYIRALIVGDDNTLYAYRSGGASSGTIAITGTSISALGVKPDITMPEGTHFVRCAVNGSEQLYIVNPANEQILGVIPSLDPRSIPLLSSETREEKDLIEEVVSFTRDTTGNYYVLDNAQSRVVVLNKNFKFISEWTGYDFTDNSRIYSVGGGFIFHGDGIIQTTLRQTKPATL